MSMRKNKRKYVKINAEEYVKANESLTRFRSLKQVFLNLKTILVLINVVLLTLTELKIIDYSWQMLIAFVSIYVTASACGILLSSSVLFELEKIELDKMFSKYGKEYMVNIVYKRPIMEYIHIIDLFNLFISSFNLISYMVHYDKIVYYIVCSLLFTVYCVIAIFHGLAVNFTRSAKRDVDIFINKPQ